jgi:raffinose/stachyose/melibiose transport system permease protein
MGVIMNRINNSSSNLGREAKKISSELMKQLFAIGMVIIVMLPILLTLFAALKTKGDMVKTSPLMLPAISNITFDNFNSVLSNKYLYIGFYNTLFIIAVSLICNVFLGSVTAYILERFEFRFKKVVFALFFLGMLIPTFVTEIARFKIIQGMNLYNTIGAPIIIYVASDLMQLYIYRQFISKISVSLDESALMEGCGYFKVYTAIILPLIAPATATVVVIKAITIINDMYIPYLYMPKNQLRTLTTFLMDFANAQQGSWQKLSAGIIIIMIPTVLIYIFFQRFIMDGLSAGAVKE